MERPTSPEFDAAIAAYYEQAPEESRLEQGASRLEALRTRELIERHAPAPPASVLDIGGAAGAYAFWLAEKGYAVRLVDASPRLVALARTRNETATHPLASCVAGDARAMPDGDDSADLVLLLGPLYHLPNGADRHRALVEAGRVLRPGGVLIAAGISRWASLLDGLGRNMLGDPAFAQIVAADLRSGRHHNPTARLDYFTTAYFHRPEELRKDVIDAGFEVEGLYGVEGPGWFLADFAERWDNEEKRQALLDVARMLESEPAMIGTSAHLLIAARNQRRMARADR